MLKHQNEADKKENRDVVGEGTDSVGAFKWTGRIEK